MPNQETIEDFFEQQTIAVLSTRNHDGTIHSAPILYQFDGGTFHLGTQLGARRVANIEKDSRCTLLIEHRTEPFRFAMVYGDGRVVEGDLERRTSIIGRMYPDDVASGVATFMHASFGIVGIEITPTEIVTVDSSQAGLTDG